MQMQSKGQFHIGADGEIYSVYLGVAVARVCVENIQVHQASEISDIILAALDARYPVADAEKG